MVRVWGFLVELGHEDFGFRFGLRGLGCKVYVVFLVALGREGFGLRVSPST